MMRMKAAWRMVVVLGVMAGGVSGMAQVPTAGTQPARVKLTKEQIEEVTRKLQAEGTTGEELEGLVKKMGGWIDSGSSPSTELAKTWLPALMKRQRYEEVAGLALRMVLVGPSTSNIRDFMPQRVYALLLLNKPEEALQAAKSLYNVSDLKSIEKANVIVAQCLQMAHRENPGIAQKFMMEQRLSMASGATTQPTPAVDPVIKTVKVDGKLYEGALAVWKAKAAKAEGDAEKYGNVLLLADQGAEAEAVFRGIAEKAVRPGVKQRYLEGVARAMKAQDGDLARASTMAVEVKPADAGMP